MQLGMNFDDARSASSVVHAFPFNSEKKRGGVAVKLVNKYFYFVFYYNNNNNNYYLIVFNFWCSLILKYIYTGKELQK